MLIERLTEKEQEVMAWYSNPYMEKAEICTKLGISSTTLNNHIAHCFEKLDETDRYSASIKFFACYPDFRSLLDKHLEKATNALINDYR
jgi:DNA-binding CsgD family transcriptional regulator